MIRLFTFVLVIIIIFSSDCFSSKWVKSDGPFGPIITTLLRTQDGTTLAGTSCEAPGTAPAFGVIKSLDDASSWLKPKDNILKDKPILGLYELKNGNILCGVDGADCYVSTDKGDTWEKFNDDLIQIFKFQETKNGNILADGYMFTSISTDGGATFSKIDSLDFTWDLEMDSLGVLYALPNEKGLWRSTDNGLTWNDFSSPTLLEKNCRSLLIDDHNYLWVSGWNSFYFSTDDGSSWIKRDQGLNDFHSNPKGTVLAQDPITGRVYVAFSVSGGVMRYENESGKWTKFCPFMDQHAVQALLFSPHGRMIVGDRNLGVCYTDNEGVSWDYTDTRVGDKLIYELAQYEENLYVGTGDGMVYAREGKDERFRPILCPSDYTAPFVMSLAVTNKGTILVSRSGGGFKRSVDGGYIWTELYQNAKFLPETMLVTGNTIYAGSRGATPGGVFKSVDDGVTWNIENGVVKDKDICALAINQAGYLFAGSAEKGLYRKSPSGEWEKTTFPDKLFIFGLVAQSDGSLIVGVANGGIYKSADNGNTFEKIDTNKVQSMTIVNSSIPFIADDIYVGAEEKTFYKDALSSKFEDNSEGFEGRYVRAILYHPEHQRIYAGGMWGGLYQLDLETKSVSEPYEPLLNIYPNPVSNIISLEWNNASSNEKIQIFSQLGVKVLETAFREKTIDVSSLPAGIYFVYIGDRYGKFVKI